MDYTERGAESSRAPSPSFKHKHPSIREEEYLEAMLILEKRQGRIRVKDLASMLGVKPPTVVEYLDKLAQKGLIEYQKHGFIRLTNKGRRIAEEVYRRHETLKKFLMMLGVPEDIAEKDACYIEHGISQVSLERIISFIEFIMSCPLGRPRFLDFFRRFLENGKRPEKCPCTSR